MVGFAFFQAAVVVFVVVLLRPLSWIVMNSISLLVQVFESISRGTRSFLSGFEIRIDGTPQTALHTRKILTNLGLSSYHPVNYRTLAVWRTTFGITALFTDSSGRRQVSSSSRSKNNLALIPAAIRSMVSSVRPTKELCSFASLYASKRESYRVRYQI